MNLFELNARLAVKLGQSLDTLYNLEYMEYSLLLNILKKGIDEKNDVLTQETKTVYNNPIKVNLPEGLKLK